MYSFYHKVLRSPIKCVIHLKDSDRRGGDFWYNFPPPFVNKYNPSLRSKTTTDYKGNTWGYGPIQHIVTLPLTFSHSIRFIGITWLAVNYILLIGAILLSLNVLEKLPASLKILNVVLWLGYYPLFMAFDENVIEIFELFMIMLSLQFLLKKKDILVGVAMGIAAMSKFLPIVFLPYFLIKRNNKAFFAMLITVLLIVIVTQFTLGWQNNDSLKLLLTESMQNSHYWTYWRSQTISSAIERFFSQSDYTPNQIYYPQSTSSAVLKPIITAIMGFTGLIAFTVIFIRRKKENYIVEYGLLSSLMILIPSHGQIYYPIFYLIGYTAALYWVYKTKRYYASVILGISYLLTGYIMQIREFDKILLPAYNSSINREVFFHFLSFPAYGGIMLFILLLFMCYSANSYCSTITKEY